MAACAQDNNGFSYQSMKHGIFLALLGSALVALGAPLTVGTPKVEHRVNPIGVSATPRFSWHLVSDERAKRQAGYYLLAATSKELLEEKKADLWDSGLIKSGKRLLIPWGGSALKEGQTVFWKVRVKDELDVLGDWSPVNQFTVGKKAQLGKPARTSGFESSSPELNKLYQESVSALEKKINAFSGGDFSALGSGADLQLAAREYLYNFDTVGHLTEWIRLMDAQRNKDGFFPTRPGGKNSGSVSSDAAVTVHFPLWWMSGDDYSVKERWPIFEEYMIAREKADPKFKGQRWGGYQARDISPEFMDLCSLGYTTRLIRGLAAPANEPLNVIRFKDYAARIRTSFKEQHLGDQHSLKAPSQTAQLLALRCGVLPVDSEERKIPEYQETVIKNLLSSLEKDGPKVGPVGANFLLQVLPLIGQQNLAVRTMLNLTGEQRSSFIESGTSEWLMSQLAGIDAAAQGFQVVRIAPNIPTDDSVKWVKAFYDSASGRVSSRWEKLPDGGLKVDVTIPPGTISRIELPLKKGQALSESGNKSEDIPGVEVTKRTDSSISLLTHSGSYSFEIR